MTLRTLTTPGYAQPALGDWDELRQELEDRRSRISEEISAYPAPIPACDAHINQLIAERERVSEELARLEEAARRGLASSDPQSLIDEFIKSSRYIK